MVWFHGSAAPQFILQRLNVNWTHLGLKTGVYRKCKEIDLNREFDSQLKGCL